ncbi:PREDICTED: katanin p80 WD40 repeat-containing subunit B1 homolog isoform X1 [Camelina sativa]|uniref:Katanin p80 WD40 repeat-containing subunit B1 homolog n=1 Tax=Camelina sativa TaxID=90675 RepID=A0ABM0VDP9_CAMSA|nr:PREDICTED: katanin p80 WD40 repeat-containing subunit B1 homolog isoform X1 [Camelina sativa]XP_010454623.1 PREDICTED: katanin p80 WD40 repeat-containing subunit B1 homolog isoform X1 [Camelina sativa]XP_010454624.1 PREDICTED: katanin p80 WD40 repeat-containing subunit B1 homolog isoform X1 [Camelina sativa]XP_010454625.1 PREDICTED: katanin p80 WD40 repeat-containing subunit B1 homolog isoform X1 [Camelina sativa]
MTTKRAYKLQEFVAHSAAVNCLKIGRKSSRVLVTGGEDHKVNLWAIGKPNAILSLYGHSSGIDSVTFDASEGLVAAGAASGTIKLWDLEEAKIVRTLTGHRSNCISVDFHPFGEFFASGSLDTNLKIWDIRKKGCIHTYKGHTRGVNVLRFTPDGRWVVSGGEDNIVKVWDLTAGKLLTEFKSHEGQIQSLDFHPHEFLLATGSADRTVKFWDLETFELIGSGGPETAGVRCLSFNPDGKTVLCGLQESLKIFSWEPIRCHDGVDVGWSRLSDMNVHEGKLLGCSYNQSCVGVWVVDLSRTEPCMAGDTAQSNGHPEKRSCSGRDPVILNDNNSKTVLGKLSVSQNVDPLLKETKSLGRLSVSQNSDSSTKETKSIGRSSISQNSDSSMKESKPLGRLSVSQNSDFSKESRTLSSTGSLPSTPHRVNSTNVSKATSGVSTAVSNAATSRRNFTKANPKANPVNKAADFAPVIVPRADPRIEQATESRAELDIIARTMPYSLQAADSRRSPSSRNNPDLPNASVLEMSESQLAEPNHILDGGTLPGGKGGMRGATERSINDFRYKRYGRSNSRSRMGSPPRNHDENYDLVSHKSNRDPSPTESQKGGRFQSLVINRERRGTNFEGPVSNFSSGNVPVPNIRPSNMFKQRGNHMPVEQGVDSPSEDNIVEDIMGKHDQFVSSMQSRLAKLQVVRRYWERNDVKNSIGSIEKMADNAVTADVLGIITERNETLTLDNCTSLLPLLTALLGSDMDQHLSVSLDLLLKLVRLYGSPIYSSLSAPASVGVDIEAEQRIERYSRCFVELEKVKACLPSLARRGGLVAKSVLELNLAFQEVSS